MKRYLRKLQALTPSFKLFEICHVPRAENSRADLLSKLATSASDQLGRTYIEYLERPSIDQDDEVHCADQEPSWMDPIIRYLSHGDLLSDSVEAKRLRWMASQYILLDEHLYKRAFSQPFLKCLGPTQADFALHEVHEGTC